MACWGIGVERKSLKFTSWLFRPVWGGSRDRVWEPSQDAKEEKETHGRTGLGTDEVTERTRRVCVYTVLSQVMQTSHGLWRGERERQSKESKQMRSVAISDKQCPCFCLSFSWCSDTDPRVTPDPGNQTLIQKQSKRHFIHLRRTGFFYGERTRARAFTPQILPIYCICGVLNAPSGRKLLRLLYVYMTTALTVTSLQII